MTELQVDPRAKALIFDLDGTLSDSLPVHMATWNTLGETFGFIFEDRIVHEMTGMPTIAFAERLVNENKLSITPEELVKLKQKAFWDSVGLIKPVELVVEIVKKYRSNRIRHGQQHSMYRHRKRWYGSSDDLQHKLLHLW